jgi:hypothetical protein
MTGRLLLPLLLLTFAAAGCRAKPSGGPSDAPRGAPDAAPAPSVSAADEPGDSAVITYADKLEVCYATVTRAGLARRSCAAVPERADEIAWRDGDEVVARLRSGKVVRVQHDGKSVELPLPPAAAWAAPKPARPGVELGPGSMQKLVVAAGGEVWLGRCAWVSLVDRPSCEAWVYARILPSPATRRDPPPERAPAFTAWSTRPPAGVEVRVEKPAGLGEPVKVVCSLGAASATFTSRGVEGATAGATVTWIAAGSPYYLLETSYDYIETTKGDVHLMKACDPNPIETVGAVDEEDDGINWGPSGYWVHRRGTEGWAVRRIERVVAELPAAEARPTFRSQ